MKGFKSVIATSPQGNAVTVHGKCLTVARKANGRHFTIHEREHPTDETGEMIVSIIPETWHIEGIPNQ